jgi:hypothetical protein
MKKIITSLALLAGAYTASAQATYPHIDFDGYNGDIKVEIANITPGQTLDCNTEFTIITKITNMSGDDLILQDTNLSAMFTCSLDSTFMSGNQSLVLMHGFDTTNLVVGASKNIQSRPRKPKEMFTVFEPDGSNVGPQFTFHEAPRNGEVIIYTDFAGVGGPNSQTGLFEKVANYVDIDTTNDFQYIIVNVQNCDGGSSVKELNANTKQILVFPNPASSNVTFNYEFASAENATVNIYDVTGRVVASQVVAAKAGVQSINLNVADLNNGMYQLEVVASNGRGVSKFTVAK